MTSAAELFYTRRSRLGRSADDDLGFQSLSPDRNLHHNHSHTHTHSRRNRHNPNCNTSNSNHRQDLDGCDPLRRSGPHGRHFCHRVSHSVLMRYPLVAVISCCFRRNVKFFKTKCSIIFGDSIEFLKLVAWDFGFCRFNYEIQKVSAAIAPPFQA